MKMCQSISFLKTLSIISFLLLLLTTGDSLRPYHFTDHGKGNYVNDQSYMHTKEGGGIGMELYPTGSSLPDCLHACGPCMPCRRVMISFNKCAVESCPVVYRCMCRGRYYHVPSN